MAKIRIAGGGTPMPQNGKEYASLVDNDIKRGITGGGAFLSERKSVV